MIVRPANEEDVAAWLPLRMALWPHCAEEEHRREMADLLRSDGTVLLAEEDDGRVSGLVEVSVRREHVEGAATSPVAYLEGWHVVPEKRGHGIGRALIAAAEAWAVAQGFTELASDAESTNEGGIDAHLKLGFRETGRTVHFVRDLGTVG